MSILLSPAFGQTHVDLGNQSKNVDFSGKSMVRPFRSGTQLPATCVTGEMFFNTNAAAGSNSFGCTAANTWTMQGSGSSSGSSSASSSTAAVAPLQVTLTNSTTLQVGSTCSTGAQCAARIGSVTYYYAAPANVTLVSGSGTVFFYVSNSGLLTAGTADALSPAATCAGCQVLTSITQYPPDAIPLASWHATQGVWDPSGTDAHALLSGAPTFIAGPNVILTEAGNTITISATVANAASSSPSSGGSSSGSGATFDPTDMTAFDRQLVFAETGFGGGGWGYGGGCGAAFAAVGVAGEVPGLGWGTSNTPCIVYYPGGGGGSYPLIDFISGTSPRTWSLKARYALTNSGGTAAGTHYVGWSSARDGTFANFVGLRYLGTANVWQCVIRAANVDVASQVMPTIPDGAVHTFAITNGGSANSLSCTIDGGSTSAAGAIPSSAWYMTLGASAAAGGSASFSTVEARIHLSGIRR